MKLSFLVATLSVTMLAASGSALADDAKTTVVKTDGGQTVYHRDMRQPLTGVRAAGQQAVDNVSDSVKATADKAKDAFSTTAGKTKDAVSTTVDKTHDTAAQWHRRGRGRHAHHRGAMRHHKFHRSSAETDALNARSLEKARAMNAAVVQGQ